MNIRSAGEGEQLAQRIGDVSRYSDDRLSLAQEIAATLRQRGHWVPKEWAGPDLITAVAAALDSPARRAPSLNMGLPRDI